MADLDNLVIQSFIANFHISIMYSVFFLMRTVFVLYQNTNFFIYFQEFKIIQAFKNIKLIM